ncbi:hypothetical protein MA16_Dca026549 [Dendrobium catenatum]|uniref:Uncharacterized protein n=1 Tax=Dendrobium catenatum TaxID=906689 RepID=A0A2I0V7Y6_9ASPA|nr:hypothetical protein MA16_Dca026549 [Dendrobium catenatum]
MRQERKYLKPCCMEILMGAAEFFETLVKMAPKKEVVQVVSAYPNIKSLTTIEKQEEYHHSCISQKEINLNQTTLQPNHIPPKIRTWSIEGWKQGGLRPCPHAREPIKGDRYNFNGNMGIPGFQETYAYMP